MYDVPSLIENLKRQGKWDDSFEEKFRGCKYALTLMVQEADPSYPQYIPERVAEIFSRAFGDAAKLPIVDILKVRRLIEPKDMLKISGFKSEFKVKPISQMVINNPSNKPTTTTSTSTEKKPKEPPKKTSESIHSGLQLKDNVESIMEMLFEDYSVDMIDEATHSRRNAIKRFIQNNDVNSLIENRDKINLAIKNRAEYYKSDTLEKELGE